MIIDPTSISFSEVKQDLIDYIDSKPEAAKWQDFYASAVGQTLIELMAGFSTFLSYQNIVGRKETYLAYAENRSSNIAISQTLGYSVYRGQNAHLTLTVTPTVTQIFNKYDVIGSVKDVDLILLEDKVFNLGVQTTCQVAVGEVKEESLIVPSADIQPFRFTSPLVSEDLRLYLNSVEVVFAKELVELINDQYVTLTNVYESVDVFYLNSVAPLYTTGDTLKIIYIELKDTSFVGLDLDFDYGVLDDYETDSNFILQEPINEIKVNAPLYHEVQKVIRGREDYQKKFKTLRSDITDTNGRDFSPAVVEVTYVREDERLFREVDKTELEEELLTFRSMGDEPTFISDPLQSFLHLRVVIDLLRNSASDDPQTDVANILAAHEKELEKTFDFKDVENEIEELSTDNSEYVKIARLYLDSTVWGADKYYRKGLFVQPAHENGRIYEMKKHIRKTNGSEPSWNMTVGGFTTDNEVVWETFEYVYPEPGEPNWDTWSMNNETNYGDFVKPTAPSPTRMFKAVRFINKSGGVEPTWNTTEFDLTEDAEVLWLALEDDGGTYSDWSATTNYNTADIVKPTTPDGNMYECIGFLSKSSGSEPTFPIIIGDTVDDGKIRWECRDEAVSPDTSAWNEYFKISHTLTVNQA